jgi:hypothetical protein
VRNEGRSLDLTLFRTDARSLLQADSEKNTSWKPTDKADKDAEELAYARPARDFATGLVDAERGRSVYDWDRNEDALRAESLSRFFPISYFFDTRPLCFSTIILTSRSISLFPNFSL